MREGVYDSSTSRCYRECPRRYFWQYVLNLVPKFDNRAPLNFGQAIHEALKTWYTTGDADQSIGDFHNIWEDRVEDTKRTHVTGEKLLKGYFERYPKENFKPISPPEQGFKIDMGGFYYVGRFDYVIEYNGMPLVMDHKTSSKMGQSYYYQFRPNIQISGYCFAADIVYKVKTLGAMINVLYLTTRTRDYFRDIIPREEWEKREFVSVISKIADEISSLPRDDYRAWEPYWSNCTRWGVCGYRDLCLCEDPYRMIGMYREEEWDPLEEYKIDSESAVEIELKGGE